MSTAPGGIAIPIRSFAHGKRRLDMPERERARILRSLAHGVATATTFPIIIVSSDPAVQAWARSFAAVIEDPGTLNEAAAAALVMARSLGWRRCVITHADLARPEGIDRLITEPAEHEVWAVCSHRDNGTPVLSLPTSTDFEFSYGIDSFSRHRLEAEERGMSFHGLINSDLGIDVDTSQDLEFLNAPIN